MIHSYGYIPDPKDERDYQFTATKKIKLPASVDMRSDCSPVRDQGMLGSCTAFSMATGLREFMLIRGNPPIPPTPQPSCLEKIIPKSILKKLIGDGLMVLSPLFLYYHERVLEGTVNWDSGATMRDGMKVLNQIGVCPEMDWPYLISKYKLDPGEVAYLNAQSYKITIYKRIDNLLDIKSALAEGYGVVFGFNVYESFETNEVANTGIMPMPKPNERLLGGHAVFICGYKDDETWAGGGYLIIKNSWGLGWGDSGFFLMPYAFADSNEVSDIWTASV
jgi:C1A family cysteine protease